MSAPEWLQEGARVAILTTSHSHRSVTFHEVERLTKTQAVVGRWRFNRQTGQKIGENRDAWGPTSVLLPADHERVLAAVRSQYHDRLVARARADLAAAESAVRTGGYVNAKALAAKGIAAVVDLIDASGADR